MRTLDDTSIYLRELGDLLVRVVDQKAFYGIVSVPESLDFNLGGEGVRVSERELLFRRVDIDLQRGDAVKNGDEVWRVRDAPRPTDDGVFYKVGLIK